MSGDEDPVEKLAAAITLYARSRPRAADTLEGVHRWWIDWDEGEQRIELTEQALLLLQARGLMTCVKVGSVNLWRTAA